MRSVEALDIAIKELQRKVAFVNDPTETVEAIETLEDLRDLILENENAPIASDADFEKFCEEIQS